MKKLIQQICINFVGFLLVLQGQVSASEIQTFMLTAEKRNDIDKQRYYYASKRMLSNKEGNMSAVIKDGSKLVSKPKKCSNPLPKKIAITSIIVSPSNRKIVRINGKFQNQIHSRIELKQYETTHQSVTFKVKGRVVELQVGNTYLTRKSKVISNYQYEQQQKRAVKQNTAVKSSDERASSLIKKLDLVKNMAGE